MNIIDQLADSLRECADDLAAFIDNAYVYQERYPAQQRRKDRDMLPVVKARKAIAAYDASKLMLPTGNQPPPPDIGPYPDTVPALQQQPSAPAVTFRPITTKDVEVAEKAALGPQGIVYMRKGLESLLPHGMPVVGGAELGSRDHD